MIRYNVGVIGVDLRDLECLLVPKNPKTSTLWAWVPTIMILTLVWNLVKFRTWFTNAVLTKFVLEKNGRE